MTHRCVMDNKCMKYYPDPTWQWGVMAQDTDFRYVCTLTSALWDMTLGQGHDTPLGHGQQLCDILSRSILAVRIYGPDTDFWYGALWRWPWRYDLGSRSWQTLLKVMDNNCVKYFLDPTWQWGVINGPDTDFWYVCTVTLTFEIWPWVKVMTHPWVKDNNCGWNMIQIGQVGMKFWPGHDVNRRTDRQGDSYLPPPPPNKVCYGGIIRIHKNNIKHKI